MASQYQPEDTSPRPYRRIVVDRNGSPMNRARTAATPLPYRLTPSDRRAGRIGVIEQGSPFPVDEAGRDRLRVPRGDGAIFREPSAFPLRPDSHFGQRDLDPFEPRRRWPRMVRTLVWWFIGLALAVILVDALVTELGASVKEATWMIGQRAQGLMLSRSGLDTLWFVVLHVWDLMVARWGL